MMMSFSGYSFCKPHSASYAKVSFQAAYLKTHFPAEFMAAVLSRNMNDIGKLNFFLSESNRMGITTLGPDVNESNLRFTVNQKGEVRFALSAIKGVGGNAVESIIEERKTNGSFTDLFDMTKRVNLRTVNKRSVENLAYAGAFDGFNDVHRAQYFAPMPKDDMTVIEKAIRHGGLYQQSKETAANSLFGDALEEQTVDPVIPPADEWTQIMQLEKEKEVTGMYISGHPLDEYRMEMKWFSNADIVGLPNFKNRSVRMAALVAGVNKRVTKKGQPYAIIKLVDFKDSMDIFVHSKDYQKFNQIMELGNRILITGVYKSRYNQPDQFELKINNVEFLSNLIDERIKGIRISVPSQTLRTEMIDELEQLFKKNKGKKQLSIHIRSGTAGNGVPMYSRSVMVDVNKGLIKAINAIDYINYKLIRN